jgi:hypothetical protein
VSWDDNRPSTGPHEIGLIAYSSWDAGPGGDRAEAAEKVGDRGGQVLARDGLEHIGERVEAASKAPGLPPSSGAGMLTSSPTALAYLSIMTPERAADALSARASALADEGQRLRETLDQTGAPEVRMIEAHYLLARLQHDREWLTATAQRIQARELAWP